MASPYQNLFGTDGIRGKVNIWPITAEGAVRAGQALASLLKNKNKSVDVLTVLIGRDTRQSGIMLERALCAGLLAEGINVDILGVCPTPTVAFLTSSEKYTAGVMLTASHNPFEDNGLKFFGHDGYKLSSEDECFISQEIQQGSHRKGTTNTCGTLREVSKSVDKYCEAITSGLKNDLFQSIKIVLDCANGASYKIAKSVFSSVGAEVITTNTAPNGENINAECGALYPEKTAIEVKKQNADLGICFDGDADRVIFVDELGCVISGDHIIALCAIALKKQNKLVKDTVVATVMSNLGMRDYLQQHNIKILTTPVGDKNVVQAMCDHNYSLGGENSGHIIFAEHATTGDGIMSALMVLDFLQKERQPLSKLANIFTPYPSKLSAISVTEKPPIGSIPELVAAMEKTETALGSKGRALVRYSGTENKIRVLVEAETADLTDKYSNLICSAIKQTIAS